VNEDSKICIGYDMTIGQDLSYMIGLDRDYGTANVISNGMTVISLAAR
jgi:hypothetical protein